MRRGFTLVEVMITLAISVVVLGISLYMFIQSIDSYNDSSLTIYLVEQLRAGLNAVEMDMRETAASSIYVSEARDAWAFASARDVLGIFEADSLYRPDWRGVIVYCHYEDSNGLGQLRRYSAYGNYRFPLKEFYVGGDYINITDRAGVGIEIDRSSGLVSGGMHAIPAYRVVSGIIDAEKVKIIKDPEGVCRVSLGGSVTGSKGVRLARELASHVFCPAD